MNSFKKYGIGSSGHFMVMKMELTEGIFTAYGYFLSDEQTLIALTEQLNDFVKPDQRPPQVCFILSSDIIIVIWLFYDVFLGF